MQHFQSESTTHSGAHVMPRRATTAPSSLTGLRRTLHRREHQGLCALLRVRRGRHRLLRLHGDSIEFYFVPKSALESAPKCAARVTLKIFQVNSDSIGQKCPKNIPQNTKIIHFIINVAYHMRQFIQVFFQIVHSR